MPLEDALACAAELRSTYLAAFRDAFQDQRETRFTLSGAIIYAHVKVALGEVLRQSHHVLDDIAKDQAGRDAIAVRVLKPGGEHLTWAQPWDIAAPDDAAPLRQLVEDFQGTESSREPGRFSSKFFHKLRARFEVLNG